MGALLVNIFLTGWIVLFAAMAILPLLLDRSKPRTGRVRGAEDRVLRVDHKVVVESRNGVREPVLVPVHDISDIPGHRPAA